MGQRQVAKGILNRVQMFDQQITLAPLRLLAFITEQLTQGIQGVRGK
jgi:hypothetical protein